jgi:hypothetical protein
MKIKNDLIMTAQAVTSTTAYSQAIDLTSMAGFSLEVVYAGATLNGDAKLQYSMDGTTYRDLPDSGSTAAHDFAASGGSYLFQVPDAYFPYVRLAITADTNTVTVTARIFAKGI